MGGEMKQVTRCKPVIGSSKDYPFRDIAYMRKDPEGEYVSYEDYAKLYNEYVGLEDQLHNVNRYMIAMLKG